MTKNRGLGTARQCIWYYRVHELRARMWLCRADVVIATDEEQVGPAVAKATGGKGAYAGLDPVGGELTGQLLASLREYGTLCVYGMRLP